MFDVELVTPLARLRFGQTRLFEGGLATIALGQTFAVLRLTGRGAGFDGLQYAIRLGDGGAIALPPGIDFGQLADDLFVTRGQLQAPCLLVADLLVQADAVATAFLELAATVVAFAFQRFQFAARRFQTRLQLTLGFTHGAEFAFQQLYFALARQPAGALAAFVTERQPVASDPGPIAGNQRFPRGEAGAARHGIGQRIRQVDAGQQRRQIDLRMNPIEQRWMFRRRRLAATGRLDEGQMGRLQAFGRLGMGAQGRHAHRDQVRTQHAFDRALPARINRETRGQARCLIEAVFAQPVTERGIVLFGRGQLHLAQRGLAGLGHVAPLTQLVQFGGQPLARFARGAQARIDVGHALLVFIAEEIKLLRLFAQVIGRAAGQLGIDAGHLLDQAGAPRLEIGNLLFQLDAAAVFHLLRLTTLRVFGGEGLPGFLPAVHFIFGRAQALAGFVEIAGGAGQLRRLFLQRGGQFLATLVVGLAMGGRLLPGELQLFLFAQVVAAGLARVFDGLFESRDLAADGVELGMHAVVALIGLGLGGPRPLRLRLGGAHGGQRRLIGVLVLGDQAILDAHAFVQIPVAQGAELGARQAFFLLELLEASRRLGLFFQPADLGLDLAPDIVDAIEVLACVADARFGLAPAFLVTRDAGRLFDETAQVLGLGLDDARDHALLDDRVGTRAQPGAQEQIGDVLAPAAGAVQEIVGLSVATGLAADGNLAVLGVFAAGTTLAVVEQQFDRGLADRLAAAGTVKHHVGQRVAAQPAGRGFTHDPADGIDDVGLAATVRPDDTGQVAVDRDGRLIDKRFKTGQLDGLEPHRRGACLDRKEITLQFARRVRPAPVHAQSTQQETRDLSQPASGAGLYHRDRIAGVHLSVPEDRPAGLRHPAPGVRPGPAVRRTQVAQALHLDLSR